MFCAGVNYVFWGGREGYQSLLNTDVRQELDHAAAFFKLAADYKRSIGATYQLLIEPKPREPMKHQYDYDVQTVVGFLLKYGTRAHRGPLPSLCCHLRDAVIRCVCVNEGRVL